MTATRYMVARAVKSVGGRRVFRRKLQEYRNAVAFINEHRHELLKENDGYWIAVAHSGVIASDRKYSNLVNKVSARGLSVKDVAIKHLSSKRVTTLF